VSDLDRRQLLQLLAAAPSALLVPLPAAVMQRAARHAAETVGQPQSALRFFTPREWETVRVLSDLIIPRDDHSGSATDAGVPEFMDWILAEYPERQTQIRGGLAWLDRESASRFGRRFIECASGEQTAVLDDIAWPAKARPDMSAGVAFFTRFRDLVANGFYSSREGVKDLGYQGNTFVTEWTGCPPEVMNRLK
jgi:hypothetical protein